MTSSFASLLRRKSPLLLEFGLQPRIGQNLAPFKAVGKIRRIIPESGDIQIDIGYKFDAFIEAASLKGEFKYRVGDLVDVLVKDLEIVSSFSGSEKFLTLKEADVTLLGINKNSI